MRLSPAMCLVRDLPVGVATDLGASGLPVQVENRTDQPMELSLRSVPASEFGTVSWERGFEPIPDATWLSLEPGQISLPPRSRMLVRPVLTLPGKPELANRRFIVGLLLTPGAGKSPVGAGLALCARMQFETQVSEDPAANAGAPLSLAPVTARQEATAAQVITRVVRLRNNQDKSVTWQLRSFEQTITNPERHVRYLAPGTQKAIGWSVLTPAAGELAAGQEVAITVTTTVPAESKPGTYEEIWFAGPAEELDLAGATEAPHQPACTFVRLHHILGSPR